MQKSLLFIFLLAGVVFNSFCQTMPTVREIYNFDVNDEFHFSKDGDGSYIRRIERFTVTDKYFSAANDTVFYRLSNSNYDHLNYGGGYIFRHYNEIIFHTNLDSLISAQFAGEYHDSCNMFTDNLFYSSELCGILSYKHDYCMNCCYGGFGKVRSYGVGIGNFYSFGGSYEHPYPHTTTKMFYYKKGVLECGVPDLTNNLSVNETEAESKTIRVYPNPADQVIHFTTGISRQDKVTILNSLGKQVLSLIEYSEGPVNISSLDKGIYFVKIENDQGIYTCKFVIDRN